MSSNRPSNRIPNRPANAAAQGMRAPAAVMPAHGVVARIVAKRQINGHIPAMVNDPMEAPDL